MAVKHSDIVCILVSFIQQTLSSTVNHISYASDFIIPDDESRGDELDVRLGKESS